MNQPACYNKLDLLESKRAKATELWQRQAARVEEVRLMLAIEQSKAQRLYSDVKSLSDTINLIQGRKILASQQLKLGRTIYCGPAADVAAAKELMTLGLKISGIKALIKSGELKLAKAR